jgi:hypothetical protein
MIKLTSILTLLISISSFSQNLFTCEFHSDGNLVLAPGCYCEQVDIDPGFKNRVYFPSFKSVLTYSVDSLPDSQPLIKVSVFRFPLENKDTIVQTITTTDRVVSYTTTSMTIDTVRKKYVPPAVNKPPVSKAGTDQSIKLPQNSVTLIGSGTDSDGTISGYSWSRISGPTTFAFTNQFSAITTVSNLVQGTYIFRLRVTDNKGAFHDDDVNVVVAAAATSTGQTLTQIGGWNAYVHLPANYNSTTTAYPTIIFFPGLGEVGTSASAVIANGPGAYITQGWNGNVIVDGSTVEFIVISLQPPAAYPVESAINQKIQSIKSLYRVDPKRLYLTGLSHGGWCATTFVTGDPLGGPYTYASQIAAVVEVQGVIPDDNSPYPGLFANFAKAGGKLLGLEQRLDNRGMPTRVNFMNSIVPNSAIYIQTNFKDGSHCCWEQFYGGKGVQPGVFNLTGINQTIYQWMARQVLKTTTTIPPAPSAACNTAKPVSYTIAPTQPGEIYITNAMTRGWKGGDTIKIPAGTYSVIEIDSFGGDPCRDIVIINSGGLVNVTGSIRLQKDVHHVKFMGNGAEGMPYGFKCKNLAFNRANHLLIESIEAGPNLKDAAGKGGGVGIYGKQDPYVDQPWTWYPNYVSTKITINKCYVHDVQGEGMYIGHTYPPGDPDQGNRIPQRMDSVTISNCIVRRTGWDGIQLSNARNGGRIFGNDVSDFGFDDIDGQRAGIISGGNTNADVYNNVVANGKGNGIEFFGYGRMECYGNTITNVGNTATNPKGEESIYARPYKSPVEVNPKLTLIIRDNQINFPKEWGAIRLNNEDNNSELAILMNNKFCIPGEPASWKKDYIIVPVGYTDVNNTLSCN